MKKETDNNGGEQQGPQQAKPLKELGKLIFLIVVLAVAWFILDKLIGK